MDGFLDQLGKGDQIKDWQHASKLFVGDNFRLAPKMGYLFHVFFDINPDSISRIGEQEKIEAGLLAVTADLPKFSFDTKTMNSYNKPNIVQSKIKYEPLTITFHDDNADVVRALWVDYFNYYYRDTDGGLTQKTSDVSEKYTTPEKYIANRRFNNFGYAPRAYGAASAGDTQQYFKSIRIYSLHQKRFSEYILVNPIITSFQHGSHQQGSADTLQHSMTINYETVLYASGNVSEKTVSGFAKIHYDKSPSTLTPSNGTRSILGPGGIIATADDVITDLSTGNLAGALFKSLRGLNNAGATNIGQAVSSELAQISIDLLRGENPINKISVPNFGSIGERTRTVVNTALNGGYSDIISSNASQIASTVGQVAVGAALTQLPNPLVGVAAAAILGKVITKPVTASPNLPSQSSTPPAIPRIRITATTTAPDGTTDTMEI